MRKKYVVSVDLGGTNVKFALVKGKKIISRREIPTKAYKTKDALLKGIVGEVREIISALQTYEVCNYKPRRFVKVAGIGIGTPGLVDYKKGVVHHLVNIKGWKDVPVASILRKALGVPVVLDNDVNLMALGELAAGAAKGAKNAVCITMGTGVGGGIIIDGKIYRGSSLSAGEIGHTPVTLKGPKCNCGGWGCLEKYVGNKAIVGRYRGTFLGPRQNHSGATKLRLTPEEISRKARRGDRAAVRTWKETGECLGMALTGVVNLLNPEVIVIGGGVAGAGKFLFGPLRDTVRKRAMDLPARTVKIVRVKLGNDAGLVGAAELVLSGLRIKN